MLAWRIVFIRHAALAPIGSVLGLELGDEPGVQERSYQELSDRSLISGAIVENFECPV